MVWEDLPNIGALIADYFLGHLEAAWPELRGSHLLATVAFPFARSLFRNRFVSHHLHHERRANTQRVLNQDKHHHVTERNKAQLIGSPAVNKLILYIHVRSFSRRFYRSDLQMRKYERSDISSGE